jgi:acyl-[acyl-carrier-protein]-phospholipid O-acyltransferase / long-chain-fatty-acid--[acyl-carrier-protein] ligase
MPDAAPADLNHHSTLPLRNKLSLWLVLGATALNAFNDNILKMMLVGLAPKVAGGALGAEIGAWLGAMILLPFVLLAPVAGWLSDRYAKRSVLIAMLVAQALILLLTGACFELAWGETSIVLALGTFFLLAVQSTFFSPSKMGILKELVGSRRLGMAAGWMQMMTMVGILSGLGIGGVWFDALYQESGNPWKAAATPIWILLAVAVLALLAGLAIQSTPSHPEMKFRHSLWWEHFKNLRECLADLPMRRAFLGNSTYWFVASMAAAMFVDIGLKLHPDPATGGAATASSHMTLMVGLGTVAGSLIVAWVNRRGLQLGIIPLGALGLALALIWAGVAPLEARGFESALLAVGLLGGCYMVPIQTFIQDRAEPEKRGRVLSSMNLLDSIAGVLGVLLLLVLKAFGIGISGQFWVLGILMCGAAVYTVTLLPHYMLRFISLLIVRTVYKVRSVHHERVPETGGVLLLSNHVSYMDAFILGAACQRPVRFVMWDELYNIRAVTWFLRIVGTVPISPTRAKDAIRSVGSALKEGRIICLFPEGQITRHGMFNDLRKGFELMARHGDAKVVPVFLDGLYGSVFSHEGGKCFKKLPKKVRYPVKVHFGTPLNAREASTNAIHDQWLDLSAAALATRVEKACADMPKQPAQAMANAVRLTQVEWAQPGDTLLCLAPVGSTLHATLVAYTLLRPQIKLITTATSATEPLIIVGHSQDFSLALPAARLRLCWDDVRSATPPGVYRGIFERMTGELLTISVHDPAMPKGEEGNQLGHSEGTLGRALPGAFTAVRMQTFLAQWQLELTENGFLKPKSETTMT